MTDKRQRGGQHVGGVGLVVDHHHAHGVVRPRAGWREIDLMGIHGKPPPGDVGRTGLRDAARKARLMPGGQLTIIFSRPAQARYVAEHRNVSRCRPRCAKRM